MPAPIVPTEEQIQKWIEENFEELGDNPISLSVGSVALWRGFKVGAKGGQSTKVEHFRGLIHAVEIRDGETFVHAT